MSAIDLTPAEAMVLLDPGGEQGREAFKVSLMWLLAQRHLKATEIPARWFKRKTTQLTRGPQAGATLPPDLKAVMMTVQGARTGLMDDIVKEARKRFGINFAGFQNDFVYPSLVGHRLLRREETSHLVFFTRQTYVHTPEGRELCRGIESLFEDARRIPGFLDRSPAQAAALAVSLGGLILLMPELRPHLEEIAGVVRRSSATDTSSGGSSGSSDAHSSDGPGSDAGRPKPAEDKASIDQDKLDFDFANLDLGDVDNFDTSLSALDASFDSSADSGSGGDGGGDGGGGGGD